MEQFEFLKSDEEIFNKHYKYYYHLFRHLDVIKKNKITTRRDLLKYFEQYNFIDDWIKLKDYLIEEIEYIILNKNKYVNEDWYYSFFSDDYLKLLKESYETITYKKFVSEINQFEFIELIKRLLAFEMAEYGIFGRTECDAMGYFELCNYI